MNSIFSKLSKPILEPKNSAQPLPSNNIKFYFENPDDFSEDYANEDASSKNEPPYVGGKGKKNNRKTKSKNKSSNNDKSDDSDRESEDEEEVKSMSLPKLNINQKKLNKPEDFWEYIEKLEWKDKSDELININGKRRLLRSLLEDEIIEFKKQTEKYMEELRSHLILSGKYFVRASSDQEENKKINAFLSHIIAKGQIFYSGVNDDPAFVDYIWDSSEYQDFLACF